MALIIEVRKRDSRIVPFDQSKISDAIFKAIRSVGGGDKALADDLAAAVTLFLEKQYNGEIPNIENIQDMVETVLVETDHQEIAKTYIEYRKKRTKIREILHVHKINSEGPEVETGPFLSSSPWSKSNIVAALVKEADLDISLAEGIASNVEEKVFNSGIRRISTSLIRELVDNELFERGYSAKLKRQAPIGFPKYNLEQVLFSVDAKEPYSFAKDPDDIDKLVSQHILRQYALEEIYSPEISEATKDGKIIIHHPGEPLRPYRINLFQGSGLNSSEEINHNFLRILRLVGKELFIPFPKSQEHLKELGLLDFNKHSIVVTASLESPFLEMPAPESHASNLKFSIFINPSNPVPQELLKQAAKYYTNGFQVSFIPGSLPPNGLMPGKVSLNLPQLSFRSGRTRLGDLFGEIDLALSSAIKSHIERRSFMERAAHTPDLPLWELINKTTGLFDLDNSTFSIGIFGLAETVKFITGKEIFQDTNTFQLAKKIVYHISKRIERESKGLGINLIFEETTTQHLIGERAEQDARIFPEMKEILRGRSGHNMYSKGVRLPQQAPIDPITQNEYLSQFFPFLHLGCFVDDNSELKSGGEDLMISLLEESIPLFSKAVRPETDPAFSEVE